MKQTSKRILFMKRKNRRRRLIDVLKKEIETMMRKIKARRLTNALRRLTKHFTDISPREILRRLTLRIFRITTCLSEDSLAKHSVWPASAKASKIRAVLYSSILRG